jgi:hypothetical protein
MPILGTVASQFSGKPFAVASFESIATVTVGSGGTSSASFDSIPNTYKHLQIRWIARSNYPGSSNIISMFLRLNGDSGSNYSWHYINADPPTLSAGGVANAGSILVSYLPASGYTSGMFGTGVIDILDYNKTSTYKTVRTFGGCDTNNTGGEKGIVSFSIGNWRSTSAISSITLANASDLSNGLTQYSEFSLYGIKG